MKTSERLTIFLACVGLMICFSSAGAFATATLRISSGGLTCTIADGAVNVACSDGVTLVSDLNSNANVVTYIGSIGVFNINVDTGISHDVPTLMDLNAVDNSNGAGTLTIEFSDTGFTSQGLSLLFGGTLTAPALSTVTLTDYSGVGLFNEGTLLHQFGPFGPGAFSGTSSGSMGAGDTSLTQKLFLSVTGNSTYSGDANISPIPEPGSLLLIGGGLIGLAVLRKVRKG